MSRTSGNTAADRVDRFASQADDPASLTAARLRRSGYPFLWGVTCEFSDGLLSLSGTVPTFFLKQVAQELASRTPGVREVNNRLHVTGLSHRAAGFTAAERGQDHATRLVEGKEGERTAKGN